MEKKINRNFPNSKLTNHPPHSTIYVSNIKNIDKAIIEVEYVLSTLKPFKIKIDKTDVFYNDKFTGGDSIFLNIKNNKKLFVLQKKVAEKLKYFSNKTNNKKKSISIKNKKLKKSQEIYGFPFIGSHWNPHFTIGSIKDIRNSKEFIKFLNTKINFENMVSNISVWKINGEKHTRLKVINLSNKK
tara:strand:+ start:849 stop:1403 length:555 start_codon:yes stop_codon:yes gene_type:complete